MRETREENDAFREVPIAQVMAEFHDGPHATPKPAASGPVFLGIKNITTDGRLDLSTIRHIDESDFRRWTRRVMPQKDDVIFTYEATLHRYALIPDGFRGCLGRRLALIRPRRDIVDPKFLHLALRGPEWRRVVEERVLAGARSTGVPLIDFPNFPISIPSLDCQRRIAAVLGAFDELIDINERRIELLEDLARSVYREWFVRFRFPRRSDEPAGTDPPGWTRRPLFDLADVGFGYSFKSRGFSATGPHAVVRIRDVPKGMTDTFTEEVAPERYAVRDGDVLVGMDGHFYVNQWSGGDAWLNQRVARLRPKQGISARHLMLAVEAPIKSWNDAIVGTTVAHLGKRHLEAIQLPMPPNDVLCEATKAFSAFGDELLLLLKLNRRLASTRDLLLPRLVTGHLDISDIDLGDLLPPESD